MKILEKIKNRKTLNKMFKLAKEYEAKRKVLNNLSDSDEESKILKEMDDVKNNIIKLNDTYTYEYSSIEKQKKKCIKECKKKLDDLYYEREIICKNLEKYRKENSEFSKEKIKKIEDKQNKINGKIYEYERKIKIAKGEYIEPLKEEIKSKEEIILEDLLKTKERLLRQIDLKNTNIHLIEFEVSDELYEDLNKELDRLIKKLNNVEHNIDLIRERIEKNEEDKD